MEIVLWIIGIHLFEIAGILGFLLIRKNKKLEEMIMYQQEKLNAISILIENMENNFKNLDDKVWVSEDEELQTIFKEMKEIQNVLSSIK